MDGSTLLVMLSFTLGGYGFLVALAVLSPNRGNARAVARLVPDCALLFRRLLSDSRVPRRHKLLLAGLVLYLLSPLDLVPDFIPIAGQLDDAMLVVIAFRSLLTRSDPTLLAEHWPGPPASLRRLIRLAEQPTAPAP